MKVLKLCSVVLAAWLGVWTQRTAGQGPSAEVVTAAVGQTATLTAPATAEILVFSWYRGTELMDKQRILTYVVASFIQTNGPQYTGLETPLPDGSLQIRDLTTSYSGDYTVSVITHSAAVTQATRRLQVYGLPQDPGFKENTTLPVTGGQPVVLVVNLLRRSTSRVSSAGVLPATFTWFNGTSSVGSGGRVEITSNASFSQMVIASAMESDSGDYVCRAENLVGATNFSLRVLVSPAPVEPYYVNVDMIPAASDYSNVNVRKTPRV